VNSKLLLLLLLVLVLLQQQYWRWQRLASKIEVLARSRALSAYVQVQTSCVVTASCYALFLPRLLYNVILLLPSLKAVTALCCMSPRAWLAPGVAWALPHPA
jgi:hypothetical protein